MPPVTARSWMKNRSISFCMTIQKYFIEVTEFVCERCKIGGRKFHIKQTTYFYVF